MICDLTDTQVHSRISLVVVGGLVSNWGRETTMATKAGGGIS